MNQASQVSDPSPWLLRIAATFAFLGVGLGAFGAHALSERLEAFGRADTWQTAVFYHVTHAVALLVLAGQPRLPRVAFWLLSAGIVVFSGSLYLLALTNATWLGAITPLGGLAFLAGWFLLAVPLLSRR
jgi:uncharacterized membrane protein YgdD (TMEM256/DUF423 family)